MWACRLSRGKRLIKVAWVAPQTISERPGIPWLLSEQYVFCWSEGLGWTYWLTVDAGTGEGRLYICSMCAVGDRGDSPVVPVGNFPRDVANCKNRVRKFISDMVHASNRGNGAEISFVRVDMLADVPIHELGSAK